MKLLFDFLPIILFFAAFHMAKGQADWSAAFASEHLGRLVSGGVVGPAEAPMLLATVVVIVASAAQVLFLKLRGRKVDTMLWVGLVLVLLFGGATIWFHNETFIKWKPTVLYWAMGGAFWASQALFGRNLLHTLIGAKVELPASVWGRLSASWIAFFAAMGALNLAVAYGFSTETWVNYKLFGGLGLMLLFTVGQGLYMSRHIKPDVAETAAPRR